MKHNTLIEVAMLIAAGLILWFSVSITLNVRGGEPAAAPEPPLYECITGNPEIHGYRILLGRRVMTAVELASADKERQAATRAWIQKGAGILGGLLLLACVVGSVFAFGYEMPMLRKPSLLVGLIGAVCAVFAWWAGPIMWGLAALIVVGGGWMIWTEISEARAKAAQKATEEKAKALVKSIDAAKVKAPEAWTALKAVIEQPKPIQDFVSNLQPTKAGE